MKGRRNTIIRKSKLDPAVSCENSKLEAPGCLGEHKVRETPY